MKKNVIKSNLPEIFYHAVNSFLAGALVFVGAFTTGSITQESVVIAVGASAVIALTKFYDYWKSQEKEYNRKAQLFAFFH